jgi:hypothetical protein
MVRKQGQSRKTHRLSIVLKRRLQKDCQNQINQVATNATTKFA